MNKILYVLIAVLFFSSIKIPSALAITGSSDAKCSDVGSSGYKEVGFEGPDEQTFTPSYDRFTGVDILVGGHLWGVDGINFTLYNAIGTVVGSGSITPTINGGPTVRSWEPASPISVRKGVTYRLRVENPNTADFVWYTGNNDCYSGGNARQKNADQNFDFGFTTYGYNVATATPGPTATPAPQNTTEATQTSNNNDSTDTNISSNAALNAGSTEGSGEAPAENISSSIKEPADLAIEQIAVNNKPVLKLNWKASTTTNISGYKIFRSEKEKSGFKNTAKIDKTNLEFKDGEVEVGKTYYYQVRAYKDATESKSSNTVSKAVVAIVPTASATLIAAPLFEGTLPIDPEPQAAWWPWLILVLIVLIVAGILFMTKKWPFNKLKINNLGGAVVKETKKGSPWKWIIVAVVILIIAGVAAWVLSREKTTATPAATEAKQAVVIPDGWKGFTSSKYGFSLSYPSDYTVAEGPTGTLKLTKGNTELVDMYVYAANGDEAGIIKSQEALYSDDTKGYMIMDSVVQGKVANIASTTINGKFGKNAGVSQTHEGVIGSTTFFANDDKLFVFNSYDQTDPSAKSNFTDLLATISF